MREIDAVMARMFPGDLVPDWVEDEPVLTLIDLPLYRNPRLALAPPVVARVSIAPQFQRVMAAAPVTAAPVRPSVPTRAYLLESPAHVARWLEEAHAMESECRLGQAADLPRMTRLMLEAIPVVARQVARGVR